jgi:hypothetical protein
MRTRREQRNRPGVEPLEGRQLTATFLSWMVGPWTAQVGTSGPSFSEMVVTKDLDCTSTNY